MNNQFDELTKGMAQSVTRRGALKKFGLGLVGFALVSLGFSNRAQAVKAPYRCHCKWPDYGCTRYGAEAENCRAVCSERCNPSGA